MSDTVSFAELDGQHVELLPARTVMSTFSIGRTDSNTGADGLPGIGTLGISALGRDLLPGGGNGVGMPGGNASG
jgi:hypothetical protein